MRHSKGTKKNFDLRQLHCSVSGCTGFICFGIWWIMSPLYQRGGVFLLLFVCLHVKQDYAKPIWLLFVKYVLEEPISFWSGYPGKDRNAIVFSLWDFQHSHRRIIHKVSDRHSQNLRWFALSWPFNLSEHQLLLLHYFYFLIILLLQSLQLCIAQFSYTRFL